MANLNFVNEIKENAQRLKSLEHMLGKGNTQPFNATNSGARKIMSGIQADHAFVLLNGEIPAVSTGYENRFGDRSSSIVTADNDYTIIAKISKFSFAPNHHYYLIMQNIYSKELSVVERISYKYVTEVYGYLNNNTILDRLEPGFQIQSNTVLKRSIGYDEFGNKVNGTNLNVVYMAMDNNMEDSVVVSENCTTQMKAPLLKYVKAIINENDIPLNIYGDDALYKVCPDIGEDIKDGILFAYRREKKEESVYTQSYERLKHAMISDEKLTLTGKVLDMNIYCNNPANLIDNIYNSQFKMYYDENQRFCNELVRMLSPYITNGFTMSYELQKLYANSKRILKGDQYTDKRQFSNIIIEFIVLEERTLGIGDKVADRYGGKGVVSMILPQHLMPQLPNGEYADCIINQSTMYNRCNPGQNFEVSINYCSRQILDYIATGVFEPEEALGMILRFINCIVPEQAAELKKYTDTLKREDLIFFIESMVQDGDIKLSARPITDCMDIDKLARIYEEFPWIKQSYLKVPIKDSNGNVRYVDTKRPLLMGKKYMQRLKQFAEEKFSATSLSSTNITNDNSRSKASKSYRELYPNTPIKFGPMESGDFAHMGTDIVVANLMLHSLSPHGRRLVESMHTSDPFSVDIKLDSTARNRSVEKLNARLKTMGFRLVFKKIKKTKVPAMLMDAVTFSHDPMGEEVVMFVEDKEHFDFIADYKRRLELEKAIASNKKAKDAVEFGIVPIEIDWEAYENENR